MKNAVSGHWWSSFSIVCRPWRFKKWWSMIYVRVGKHGGSAVSCYLCKTFLCQSLSTEINKWSISFGWGIHTDSIKIETDFYVISYFPFTCSQWDVRYNPACSALQKDIFCFTVVQTLPFKYLVSLNFKLHLPHPWPRRSTEHNHQMTSNRSWMTTQSLWLLTNR